MLVFFFFNDTATTEIYTLSLHDALPISLALGREVLDAILVDRVRALGVELRERTRVTDVLVDDGHVVGVEAMDADTRVHVFRAPLVVAADGRASVVARRLGLLREHRLQRMALVTFVRGVSECGEVGEIFIDPPDYAILNPIAPEIGRAHV